MPEKFNFTQERIKNLPSPIGKDREYYYDIGCPKLLCRISHTGNKSFAVMKKSAEGKTLRITLGRFPDLTVSEARKMAQAALTELAQGINPTEEKRKQRVRSITLQELLNRYLKDKCDLREASILDYTVPRQLP